jgi:hypothetical protein
MISHKRILALDACLLRKCTSPRAVELRYRIRFAPIPAASMLQARCNLTGSLDRSFSREFGIIELPSRSWTPSPLGLAPCRLSLSGPSKAAYGLGHRSLHGAQPILLRPCSLQRHPWQDRTISLFSITYASRPRLRYRLTFGWIILPLETLGLGGPYFSWGLSLLLPE